MATVSIVIAVVVAVSVVVAVALAVALVAVTLVAVTLVSIAAATIAPVVAVVAIGPVASAPVTRIISRDDGHHADEKENPGDVLVHDEVCRQLTDEAQLYLLVRCRLMSYLVVISLLYTHNCASGK